MKLYEINILIETILEKIETDCLEHDGEISPEFSEELNAINMLHDEKVLNVAKFIKGLNAESEAIKNETDKLMQRRKSIDKKVEWLKNYIDRNCESKEKIQDSTTIVSWRKSESVKILNENLLPKQYIKEKIEISVDKMKIKESIKNGEEVTGAEIETNFNLQIK